MIKTPILATLFEDPGLGRTMKHGSLNPDPEVPQALCPPNLVKEFNLSYRKKRTILFTIDPYCGTLSLK